ncbi:SWIM zinc finger family protein [Paenibacillus thiaminolyticus]|uniref:SWIM zinc finger family protein n=1 Tax=Paenibacillus thiaminolyticus TaxID=49283 RepID=UPI00116206B8|nr:SWIM zinc finger family protein [Paenibacillus thiaminolyticus]NGP60794.1 hypothetical protein [Paenibacillus thiaminolyticus]WCR25598.1 SWIM zinc finger family protein [Paenibacillus thiaminolyticus]
MKLTEIENTIDPIVLERGEAYWENGHIVAFREAKPRVYRAEVEGAVFYNVEIKLSSRGEVVHSFCDCPYDKGPICKHVVAVLLAIRHASQKKKAESDSEGKTATKKNMADHLFKLSKDELVELLVHFSNEITEVEQALSLKFMDAGHKESLNHFKKMIRSSIKQNSDRSGFVAYRKVAGAVTGAENILQKAEEALDSGNYVRAAEINFCIMHEMGDLLQMCDDSGGIVGGLIQECLHNINRISVQLENSSSKDRAVLFQRVLKEVLHPNTMGWNEWQLSLLESASYLMETCAEKDLWSELIAKLEAHEKSQSFSGTFFTEHAAILRYQVIQKFEGDSVALQFLQDHLDNPHFRKMAIEDAIKRQEFDRALELAEQGEQQDAEKGYHGLVKQWEEYRFEIYGHTRQVDLQKKLAEESAVLGDYHYYLMLKELYSRDEWEEAYERLLAKLEDEYNRNWRTESLYTRVLVEEKETEKLLNYVRKNKRTVLDYYPHLISKYAEEVFVLFTQTILEEIAHASNRNQYQKGCRMIRDLIKAGGAVHAEKVIEQLCTTYPNRPALIDELRKIKRI